MSTDLSTPTITTRLADHVAGLRYDDIPAPVVEKAKLHLAHLLGTAFRGHQLKRGRRGVQLAHELSGAERACSIVGEVDQASLLDAIFANSLLIGCDGRDDFLLPQGAHPGIVVQPVAWALGELTRASGRELLTATLAGYDVLATLCDPALTWERATFRPASFVFEPFAAAATAARLLGLSRDETACALGHAGQMSRHRTEVGDATMTIHPLLARCGGLAAMLARAGMPAEPTVVEGEHGMFRMLFDQEVPAHVEAGLAALGRDFSVMATDLKQSQSDLRHPAVIPVELARRLLTDHALDADRVAAVDVTLPVERELRETGRDLRVRSPEADFTMRRASLSFQIAVVLADGRVERSRLEQAPDVNLLATLDKVHLSYEAGRPLLYTRVDVATTDGQTLSVVDDGEAGATTSADGIGWLRTGAQAVLPEDRLSRLIGLVERLEEVTDVSELVACVRSPATDVAPS